MYKSLEKGILKYIFTFVAITSESKSQPVHLPAALVVQLREGVLVSQLSSRHQHGFVLQVPRHLPFPSYDSASAVGSGLLGSPHDATPLSRSETNGEGL